MKKDKAKKTPVIGIYDLETSPLISYTWGIHDQDIGLNQIIEDRYILSFSFKFLGESKVYYADQSKCKDMSNDKKLVEQLRDLLEQCDIVIGQNSISYDTKFVKTRMIVHNMKPLNNFKQIDTLRIARKHFNFTSNKLEWLSKKLCKHKKSSHKKFGGFELWKECLKGNKAAWKEMKSYNIRDVLATEELYMRLRPFDNSFNPNVYGELTETVCTCGSTNFIKNGHAYTAMGKFARFKCSDCGKEARSRENLLSKEKRKSLRS
jgi:RNase_H superfamily